MLTDRIVVDSHSDAHSLFNVFQAYYPTTSVCAQALTDHHHSQLEISAIVSGTGIYNCSGIDYDFSPGDVFFHCGNDNHTVTRIGTDQRLSFIVIQFEPRLIWNLGEEWFDTNYLHIFMEHSKVKRFIPHQTETAERICALLNESYHECKQRSPSYELLVKAKLLMILSYLTRYYYDEISRFSYRVNAQHIRHIEDSMDYILAHLEEKLTLDELAKEAQMSRSHYSAVFKTLNGISVWTYITHQRIRKAKSLLMSTAESVTEISQKCGFNTLANFNRAFRQYTGKAPGAYRKDPGE